MSVFVFIRRNEKNWNSIWVNLNKTATIDYIMKLLRKGQDWASKWCLILKGCDHLNYTGSIPSADPKTSPFPSAVYLLFPCIRFIGMLFRLQNMCLARSAGKCPRNWNDTKRTRKKERKLVERKRAIEIERGREKPKHAPFMEFHFLNCHGRLLWLAYYLFFCVFILSNIGIENILCLSVGNVTYLYTLARIS